MHLFAGAGGGLIADKLLGHRPVCAVEINTYCQRVLAARQQDGSLPWFPIFGDVATFDGTPWSGLVDLICAGFPCKGVSPARTNSDINGAIVGIDGASSELWAHIPRIAVEAGYPDLFIENSSHLVTRGLCRIVSTLDAIGYECRWCVLGSGHIQADHERERLWLKATHPNSAQRQRRRVSSRVHPEYTNLIRPGWWQDQPGLERVANGMASQMDRLRAIGNGQNCRIAALAYTLPT